jgi:4-methylaminobutanoate oxidase (formaldehyde-forming)
MHAMDSMRIEKAFRHWGHDIGTHDTILEAGLGFTCDFSKDFIGRAAVEKQRAANLLKRRMVQFAMQDPALLLYHNEPIYRDGQRVGLVTSANYGHTLGAAIGMGYVTNEAGVDADFIKSGQFEIAIAGKRHAAKASLRPMVDPTGARMKV